MINHFAKCSIVKPIHVVKLAIRGTKITDHGRTLLSDEHYEERVYDEMAGVYDEMTKWLGTFSNPNFCLLTVTMRPFSWKYLTSGTAFCLKLARRRSVALGLSSGRPCCSALFSKRSFKRWLEHARKTTRSGVQI